MHVLFAVLAGLGTGGEERGTFTLSARGKVVGEESYRFETVEDHLVCHFSSRREEGRSDAVLTLSAADLRPLLYAAVHRRGREATELRLEWKNGVLRSRVKAGGREISRERNTAAREAFLDERLPSQVVLWARSQFEDVRMIGESGETTGKIERAGRRLRWSSGATARTGAGGRVWEISWGDLRWALRPTPEMFAFTRPAGMDRVPAVLLLSTDPALCEAIRGRLIRSGMAVASTEPVPESTLTDEVADAAAALDWLASRSDVDSSRWAIVGHGDAGLAAAPVVARFPKARALFLLATPGRQYPEVLLARMERDLRDSGAEILEDQRRRLRELAQGSAEFEVIDGRRTFVAGLRERMRHDPLEALRPVLCPVVLMQGCEDDRIAPENADLLEAALRKAGRTEVVLSRWDDLDHGFRGKGASSALDFLVRAAEKALRP